MNTPPDGQTNRRILVIDDNRDIHNYFREILHGRPVGFTMESAYQGVEGVQLLHQALEKGEPYAVAFVDMQMPPGIDGIETITKLWELDADLQVVI
ncbi:MAG: response regulator, partial [Chthoniobacterales bacterium]